MMKQQISGINSELSSPKPVPNSIHASFGVKLGRGNEDKPRRAPPLIKTHHENPNYLTSTLTKPIPLAIIMK